MPTVPTASGACASAVAIDELDDARRAEKRILAARHRGRARMALETGEVDLVPALALAMRDDADLEILGLEDRALLDVKLEESMDLALSHGLVALEADARKLLAELLALLVLAGIGEVLGVDAGEDARGDHRRREAGAFLIRPIGDLDRALRLDLEVVERANAPPSAPSTPSTPSNFPPVGWVSRCEPIITGGKAVLGARGGARRDSPSRRPRRCNLPPCTRR